jgi:hypothetical protein
MVWQRCNANFKHKVFQKHTHTQKKVQTLQAIQLQHFVSLVIRLHFKLQAQAKKYLTPLKLPNKTLFLANHLKKTQLAFKLLLQNLGFRFYFEDICV